MKHLLTISIVVFIICVISLMFPYSSHGYYYNGTGERIIMYGNDEIGFTCLQLFAIIVIAMISCIKKTRATSIIAFILCIPFGLYYFLLIFVFTFFKSSAKMELGYYLAVLAAIVFFVSHFINIFKVFKTSKSRPSEDLIDDDLLEIL